MERTIVLVDDHSLFRNGLRGLLEHCAGCRVVGEAASGEEFLAMLPELEADIVFMDFAMPGIDGAQATERALARRPDLRIITLSMFGEESYYTRMVQAGARGFLLKDSDIGDVVEAIDTVMAGGSYFSPQLLSSLAGRLRTREDDPDEELSDGETPDEPETVRIDPDCAEKLEHARGRILNLIKEKRPRFVPAFELMTFRDNTISVSVPTTELREEILRSKTGMLMRIAELAGIEGMIELEVTVNEEIRAARPIKLEDRVRYITEKNPLVAELRKALDLEVE